MELIQKTPSTLFFHYLLIKSINFTLHAMIYQTVAHAGIPKNTLLRKIRKYDLNPAEYGPVDQDGEESAV